MISDSELSDDFSLDTVGSHGDVKCKGRYKDYLVRGRCLEINSHLHELCLKSALSLSVYLCDVSLTSGWCED